MSLLLPDPSDDQFILGVVCTIVALLSLLMYVAVQGYLDEEVPVVCHANYEGVEVAPRPGDYGRVTRVTCYNNHFNGSEVTVLFVD